ncbi:hypothetical protein [Thermoplasma volcanium GSS1]|uniref:Glycosyl transferase family 1 domain-containing protein n=1 Tax=Thermoplasma volcanium (strain ATCC 51530 / DSM 4299 / JCM 9571 / NBRC 15438 / GSS1) TaxID=273116 RepID=Q97AD3_THEVO|nr:glycosyltransferase [Thermoplasma volcanium]BAB60019.1 hypothetical protein [Thermoplasma volcanium GSS1]
MKIALFTNTNVSLGAGIEKTLLNYVKYNTDHQLVIVQSQFYKVQRLPNDVLDRIGIKNVVTIKDYEHCISFLRMHRITKPIYALILPLLIRITKVLNIKKLRSIGELDVVYLFKNEYWPLFKGKLIIGSNHAQFAFDNTYNRILALLVRSGLVYRGIDAFHLFPKSKGIGKLMGKRYFTGIIGVETSQFKPKARDNTVNVLFVGRLEYIKGIDLFIEVCKKFEGNTGVKFNVSGGGEYSQILNDNKLPNLTYHGVLSEGELADLYGKCDIFLYPTRWDAQPSVIAEALSAGEYIITSQRIRGTYDDLSEKGFLEYSSLSLDDLSNRLLKAIDRVAELRAISDAEHSYAVEKYDNSVVVRDLYKNIENLYISMQRNQH